jgi:uncharacterized membrane protein
MNVLQIVLRWMHIVPAVVAGGAAVFSRFALMPSLATLPEAERSRLREAINGRWRLVVAACITLLLVSGLANFVMLQVPAHKGQALYHALFGIKFLAALTVFFLASALTGRSPALAPIRANAGVYAGISAALVILILLISGVLRNMPAAT